LPSVIGGPGSDFTSAYLLAKLSLKPNIAIYLIGVTKLSKVCFVIGPIGAPDSEVRKEADEFIHYIVKPCVTELGYGLPRRADLLPEPGRITSQIIELLNSADLVVADLTRNNANVYYELSCRHAIGKPAIHMAQKGTPLSFDIADNRTIFYSMHVRAVEEAIEDLRKQIETISEPKYKSRNPIFDAIGLIELEKSTEPMQQAVAQITRDIASLRGEMADVRSRLPALQLPASWEAGGNMLAALQRGQGFYTPAQHNLFSGFLPGGAPVGGPGYVGDPEGANNLSLKTAEEPKDAHRAAEVRRGRS
jgi:hypothetical protein